MDRLLTSIQNKDFKDANLQIRVVSNLHSPEVEKVCNRHSELSVHYASTGLVGVNRARNLGLQQADTGYVLFLDDDCILPAEFSFSKIFAVLLENPGITVFGGHYLLSERYSLPGLLYYIKMQTWLLRYTNADNDALRLLGGSFLVNKKNLNGLEFDSKNVFGGTETELILRLLHDQHRLKLLPALNVIHDFNIELFDLLKKTYKQAVFHHQMPGSAHSTFEQNLPYATIEAKIKKHFRLNFFNELLYRLIWFLHKLTVNLAKLSKRGLTP